MSTFKWEIFEPAEETEPTVDGGKVQLADIHVVPQKTDWEISPPDAVPREPQPSGEINFGYRTVGLRISGWVFNFAVIVAVLVLGFIIVHDTVLGKLTFEKFFLLILGLDVADRRISERRNKPAN